MTPSIITIISWIFIIFIISPIIIFIFYLFTNEFNKIYVNYLVGIGSKWHQRLFLFPLGILSFFIGRNYIKRHSINGKQEDYAAIVRANNYFPENVFPIFFGSEKKLVKYLYNSNKNYRVYDKITLAQLKKIIMDKKIKSLIIFGHGDKHGVRVGKDEVLYYCDLPKSIPNRHLVAQFHCNHYKGKGMMDYGGKAKYLFVREKLQNDIDVREQVDKIIKDNLL